MKRTKPKPQRKPKAKTKPKPATLTVEAYEAALEAYCLGVAAEIAKTTPLHKLDVSWGGSAYWDRAFDLTWYANDELSSESASQLDIADLPDRAVNALRKRYPKMRGFFLGTDGDDTVGEDLDYEPSEYADWVKGVFSEAAPRVQKRVQKQLRGCAFSLGEHDGGLTSLKQYIRDAGEQRARHDYEPTATFLGELLALFSTDRKQIARWVAASPKPQAAKAKAKRARELRDGDGDD